MKMKTLSLAIISGCFGTAGSVFAKLAAGVGTLSWIELLSKLILYIIMIILNTICNLLFVNSLVSSTSSTPPTVVSSTTSYLSAALAGFIFFNETISFMWWCGTSLVLLGLILICTAPSNEEQKPHEAKKNN